LGLAEKKELRIRPKLGRDSEKGSQGLDGRDKRRGVSVSGAPWNSKRRKVPKEEILKAFTTRGGKTLQKN